MASARAALSIRLATASGCDARAAWLAGTSTTVLPARLAIVRIGSGLMTRSGVAIRAQLGVGISNNDAGLSAKYVRPL